MKKVIIISATIIFLLFLGANIYSYVWFTKNPSSDGSGIFLSNFLADVIGGLIVALVLSMAKKYNYRPL